MLITYVYCILSLLPIALASSCFGRDGGSYDDRRFVDERFSRENVYPRGAFQRDVLERDNYPPPPSSVGMWPQTRRRSYEEVHSFDRDIRRHEKLYVVSYYELFICEADSIMRLKHSGIELWDGIIVTDDYHDHDL